MKFLEFIKKLFGAKEEEIQFPAPVKKPRKPAVKRVAIKEPKKKVK